MERQLNALLRINVLFERWNQEVAFGKRKVVYKISEKEKNEYIFKRKN